MSAPERLRALVAEATPGPWRNLIGDINGARGEPILRTDRYEGNAIVSEEADARLIALAPQLAELCADMGEALMALHERVEMDESVGICLSSRVESLSAGAALARLDALFPEEEA